jgi:hypothetical protein
VHCYESVGEKDQSARGAQLQGIETKTDNSGHIVLCSDVRGHSEAKSEEVEVQIRPWLVVPSHAVQSATPGGAATARASRGKSTTNALFCCEERRQEEAAS